MKAAKKTADEAPQTTDPVATARAFADSAAAQLAAGGAELSAARAVLEDVLTPAEYDAAFQRIATADHAHKRAAFFADLAKRRLAVAERVAEIEAFRARVDAIPERYAAVRAAGDNLARAVAAMCRANRAFDGETVGLQAELADLRSAGARLGIEPATPTLDGDAYGWLAFRNTALALGGQFEQVASQRLYPPSSPLEILREATTPADLARYPADEQVRDLLALRGEHDKRRQALAAETRAALEAARARALAQEAELRAAYEAAEKAVGPGSDEAIAAVARHVERTGYTI